MAAHADSGYGAVSQILAPTLSIPPADAGHRERLKHWVISVFSTGSGRTGCVERWTG